MHYQFILVLVLLGLSQINADNTPVTECAEGILPTSIIVGNVGTPCMSTPCEINTSSAVQFAINFTAPEYMASPYQQIFVDLIKSTYPLIEHDACKGISTSWCPIAKGEDVSYIFNFKMPSLTPTGINTGVRVYLQPDKKNETSLVFMSLVKKTLSTKFLSKFIVNSTKSSQNFSNQPIKSYIKNDKAKYLKYFLLFTTGYVTYRQYKDKINFVPQISAAAPFLGSVLSGRRKQFNFIADVVETSAPSVVYIEIKDSRRVDFFTGRPATISNGSGFIIKEDGLILTNAHVITNKPNAKVEVRLINGTTYNGVVEDFDVKSDLALVRISARNLPVMKLGNSADLKPGEFVVAIGSPLALSNTVTCGVVSSTQRNSDELGLYGKDMIYIQTDAAITFGNSGGPLVNLDGEAIGVNSMKVTAGISFAIPIDYVKAFIKNAKGPKRADIKKLYMGITMLTLTPEILHELQQRNHLVPQDIQSGVLVWKVIIGSPAHSGGLQPGDIVTHIDGKMVQGAQDVYSILSNDKSKTLKMLITREGTKREVVVTPEVVS
ncbi:unnamed protein product [Brassicogethes aeneus]|uniref:Serine protease HTRA2, mitochondrial n=1 Tax=Brassicogethes aeneus TaxID=1431903 RepID=A0A9P0ATP3_BRAAE|nr:unnamed protein product [Brassicogethes aeneus]